MAHARRRLLYFAVVLSLCFLALELRLFHLQVIQNPVALESVTAMSHTWEKQLRSRGRIVMRNGYVLAESLPSVDLYANSRWTRGKRDEIASRLSDVLGETGVDLRDRLERDGYVRLLKKPLCDGDQIVRLLELKRTRKLDGIELEQTWVRHYPESSLAAHVVGFVNAEGKGQAGIERCLEPALEDGSEAIRVMGRDAARRPMLDLDSVLADARPGSEVRLTLDVVVQYFAEEALDQVMAEHKPKWASIVVIEPMSGDLLAMASRPTFDPNRYGSYPLEHLLNRSVSFHYTPGSTFKPFIMASVLSAGSADLNEMIDCRQFQMNGRRIVDSHPNGLLTPIEIMVESSNIGMSKLALRLIPERSQGRPAQQEAFERIHELLTDLGLGQGPRLPLPAVTAGMLSRPRNWSRTWTVPSLSFGHEISVSPVQLAAAFQVFANGGYYIEPRLVEALVEPNGLARELRAENVRPVFDRAVTRQITEMLVGVVDRGTGTAAALQGYSVAGKTSTAQWERDSSRYTSSFVGYAPASDPRLLVAVVVDQPAGKFHSGGKVAAPAAGEVLGRSLNYLGVRQDRMDTSLR